MQSGWLPVDRTSPRSRALTSAARPLAHAAALFFWSTPCPAGMTVMHACCLLRGFALTDYSYHAMCVKPHQERNRHVTSSQARRIQDRFQGGKAPYFAPPEIHPIME